MSLSTNNTITIQELNYHPEATIELFDVISNKPWSMLLRSASTAHINSRFDILVAAPKLTLETYGETTKVTQNGNSYESADDPFALLKKLQATHLPQLECHDVLPFLGGALGYFSYDLGRRVETMPSIAERDINAPDMAVGLYDWAIVADHQAQTLHLLNLDANTDRLAWLQAQVDTGSGHFTLTSEWQSNMSRESYGSKFDQVKAYIRAGDCYQINLAQRFSARYQGDEWQAYKKLEQANQAPFSGFIRLPEHAILSISPERFLELKGSTIETKPIKGTRPRRDDPIEDEKEKALLGSTEKDRAENLMIVDLLRNDIGRVAKPGTVTVPKLFDIESFPAVHHLVSTVTAELNSQYSAADLLRAGFPGGSITGAPKVRAMEIIEELEPHRRSVYCGSIGYISNCGRMDSSITIRTLISQDNVLHAWAGGGLVYDSEVNSEYQETLDKLNRILPTLK
ncbi:aminodeoxychorismate synthase component 1 [Thaumasiovibrio subtropicus]|uniref:aminodeoxychorismate synthase component 1 n=1 Tax=Thaumasiovibrio subtropicus TaxID=1891207 RepID=UPI000B362E41|nr:aminodeoxychorismate synthase component 1 [Thaumasiovibrio subtropicus]